ncbi:MAG: cell division protein FtsX, partial [Xanthomonadales bacterium]|nr:cell division protein FtsX [Xanthomonadales bacterium]
MTIRPILSALLRNRTGAVLVIGQIALTLAIVVNALFIIQQRLQFMNRPSGMDVENIITANNIGFGAEYQHDETMRDDLAAIRSLPGVIAATTINSMPLSGSGSAGGWRASAEEDATSRDGNYYFVTEQGQAALGFE